MRFVIAQRRLAAPGGSETFVITLAEHISRLGHEVVVHSLELGLAATIVFRQVFVIAGIDRTLPAPLVVYLAIATAAAFAAWLIWLDPI